MPPSDIAWELSLFVLQLALDPGEEGGHPASKFRFKCS